MTFLRLIVKDPKIMELIKKIITQSATEAEQKQHQQMLAQEDYKKEFDAYQKIWHKSACVFNEYNVNTNEAWYQLERQTTKRAKSTQTTSSSMFKWMKYAAAIIVLVTGSYYLWQYQTSSMVMSAFHSSEVSKELTLADGTMVILNRNSSLEVMDGFNNHDRRVILKGEAFFEVAKNKDKPFIIACDGTETEVLGTSFNIYSNALTNTVELNVATGLVSYKHKNLLVSNEEESVAAGESCIYDKETGELKKSNSTRANYLSWQTKNITFSNTNITEVCHILSHDFNQNVVCRGENLNKVSITVAFSNQPLATILDVISIAVNAKVVEEESAMVLIIE